MTTKVKVQIFNYKCSRVRVKSTAQNIDYENYNKKNLTQEHLSTLQSKCTVMCVTTHLC